MLTITRNWNSWQGGKVEQITDDVYVRGNLRPLGTKVAGIVRDVPVSDYQQVHKQIALAFGVDIDKDVVRRILGIYFRPETGCGGPSWLSFIAHAKDSLWSVDLVLCESAMLRTYWILVAALSRTLSDTHSRVIQEFAINTNGQLFSERPRSGGLRCSS